MNHPCAVSLHNPGLAVSRIIRLTPAEAFPGLIEEPAEVQFLPLAEFIYHLPMHPLTPEELIEGSRYLPKSKLSQMDKERQMVLKMHCAESKMVFADDSSSSSSSSDDDEDEHAYDAYCAALTAIVCWRRTGAKLRHHKITHSMSAQRIFAHLYPLYTDVLGLEDNYAYLLAYVHNELHAGPKVPLPMLKEKKRTEIPI